MDNKELQKTVNPVYLTAKGTLGFLYRAKDPDAVALWPLIGLETNLQERAKDSPDGFFTLMPGTSGGLSGFGLFATLQCLWDPNCLDISTINADTFMEGFLGVSESEDSGIQDLAVAEILLRT